MENPWEPSEEEDDTITEIVLEDRGLDAIPNDGSDEKTKFDNVVVQYKRTMAYLREILNHTFLRAIYQDKQSLNTTKFKETLSMIIAMMIQMMNRQSSQHSI